ncbi:MAG: histidine--tRNA ligase [Desulfovibrio sp.]|jgi:histidyl-tRNA synthetase|nr:histidine--tRNA ligase [Desulfovibrio sp.]
MNTPGTVKGFTDIFHPQSALYSFMEDTARRVFGAYGFEELRLPVLEFTELFRRGIGCETDIVQKEMYTFPDRKGRSLTMRPEATAGTIRAYLESGMYGRGTVNRLYTCGPMFRYERPQAGRMRQFHQINCECLGAGNVQTDAEVLLMLASFLHELGLEGLRTELNTLGCRVCRPGYKEKLSEFLHGLDPDALCPDCRRRIENNPLRVLDCKVPACRAQTEDAPAVRDHVCAACAGHFEKLLGILGKEKLRVVLNPRLVRGLDYYMRTTFEIVSENIGAQGSVAGGGRYDGLTSLLGGPEIPGIGFACGMERLALALAQAPDERERRSFAPRPDFYFAVLDAECADGALHAAQILRTAELSGIVDFGEGKLGSKLRQASRAKAEYCLIFGATELAGGKVIIKNMDEGSQVSISLATLADWAEIRFEHKREIGRKGGCR